MKQIVTVCLSEYFLKNFYVNYLIQICFDILMNDIAGQFQFNLFVIPSKLSTTFLLNFRHLYRNIAGFDIFSIFWEKVHSSVDIFLCRACFMTSKTFSCCSLRDVINDFVLIIKYTFPCSLNLNDNKERKRIKIKCSGLSYATVHHDRNIDNMIKSQLKFLLTTKYGQVL